MPGSGLTPAGRAAWQTRLNRRSSLAGCAIRHAERLSWMDTVGLDTQVVALTSPGVQNLEPADATTLQLDVNDRLADATRNHPDRLQAFATLATPVPDQAASELHRVVRTLGLDGALVFPRTRERWLDDPQFTPTFEAAAELRAPRYLHPQIPVPAVRNAYYAGLGDSVSSTLATFRIGWHYDTGVALLRLIFAGALDRFPDLQIILGHWGEVVLFYLERTAWLAEMATAPDALGVRALSGAHHLGRHPQRSLSALDSGGGRSRPHHVGDGLPLRSGGRRRPGGAAVRRGSLRRAARRDRLGQLGARARR